MKKILFDIDGTLIDTLHLYFESYLKTIKHYPGLEILTPEALKEINPTSEYRTMEKIAGKEKADEAYGFFLHYYCKLFDEFFQGIFPGVVSMLNKLRQTGYKIGLVTGKSKATWEFTAKKVQLGDFDVIITDNDVKNPKPDPEGLIMAAELLNIRKKDMNKIIYVGDSLSDYKAAENAGMIFGAALWASWANIGELVKKVKEKGGPNFILEKSSDLFDNI